MMLAMPAGWFLVNFSVVVILVYLGLVGFQIVRRVLQARSHIRAAAGRINDRIIRQTVSGSFLLLN
jgi:hypothetical protein